MNSSNHDHVSKQFLGGLPAPFGNLGVGSNGVLFSLGSYDGKQFFVVPIPEPSSLILAAIGGASVGFWRRWLT